MARQYQSNVLGPKSKVARASFERASVLEYGGRGVRAHAAFYRAEAQRRRMGCAERGGTISTLASRPLAFEEAKKEVISYLDKQLNP